eukprot:33531-Pyramimonas_sp.AAC.3
MTFSVEIRALLTFLHGSARRPGGLSRAESTSPLAVSSGVRIGSGDRPALPPQRKLRQAGHQRRPLRFPLGFPLGFLLSAVRVVEQRIVPVWIIGRLQRAFETKV